jgi:hypothetical protein
LISDAAVFAANRVFISLTHGFSRVKAGEERENGFNRLPSACAAKPLKRLHDAYAAITGLKPGVNEKRVFRPSKFDAWCFSGSWMLVLGISHA